MNVFMKEENIKDTHITQTTVAELETILQLFKQAMEQQGKNGYRVWDEIDTGALRKDIEQGLQFKITTGIDILCLFSIQRSDPLIWRDRDRNDAIYLHRIVVNPNFKGQKQFKSVLDWSTQYARDHNLKFIRMDTWASNQKLINYYESFGFKFIETYTTPDTTALPIQNRNLTVALLEIELINK